MLKPLFDVGHIVEISDCNSLQRTLAARPNELISVSSAVIFLNNIVAGPIKVARRVNL